MAGPGQTGDNVYSWLDNYNFIHLDQNSAQEVIILMIPLRSWLSREMRCWRLGSNLTWDMMTFLTWSRPDLPATNTKLRSHPDLPATTTKLPDNFTNSCLISQTCRVVRHWPGAWPGDLGHVGHCHPDDTIAPDTGGNDDTIAPDNDTVSVPDTSHISYPWC